jgi:hypothetical protein
MTRSWPGFARQDKSREARFFPDRHAETDGTMKIVENQFIRGAF